MSQVLGAFELLDFTMLRRVFKLTNRLFLEFSKFFFSGRGQPLITETAGTAVHLYFFKLHSYR